MLNLSSCATLSSGNSFGTTYCFTCLNDYSNTYFCKDQSTGGGYCCESSLSSKTTTTNCLEDSNAPRNCSFSFTSSDLKYSACFQSESICGSDQSLVATTSEFQSLTIADFYYSLSSPCYYTIEVSSSDASAYKYIQINVEYVFASKLEIFTGTTLKKASNKTVATTQGSYLFPITSSSAQQTIYIIVIPDNQSKYSPSAKFTYKVYTENYYDYTLKYITGSSSAYTGNIALPTVLIPLLSLLMIPPSVYIAYLSNKHCFLKPAFVDVSNEFKQGGRFGEGLNTWKHIENLMLKKNVNEAPLVAPKQFQIEYLERLEQIKAVERKLDRKDIRDRLANHFEKQEQMEDDEVEEIDQEKQQEIDEYQQQEMIEDYQEQIARKMRKLTLFQDRPTEVGLSSRASYQQQQLQHQQQQAEARRSSSFKAPAQEIPIEKKRRRR